VENDNKFVKILTRDALYIDLAGCQCRTPDILILNSSKYKFKKGNTFTGTGTEFLYGIQQQQKFWSPQMGDLFYFFELTTKDYHEWLWLWQQYMRKSIPVSQPDRVMLFVSPPCQHRKRNKRFKTISRR
jgi:hypothetical protein